MVTVTRAQSVSTAFVKLADTLVAEYDVLDLLHSLVDSSVQLLDAAAAGLLLADPNGQLKVLAATSEESRLVETLQQRAGVGPCIDCFRSGVVVTVEDVGAEEERWPEFCRASLSQGFRSVHAIPMRLHGKTIGALNLFRTEAGTLDAEDTAIGQGLADVATIGILQERTIRESATVNEQLQRALNSRISIEQAKGVISHLSGVDMDEAFRRLRHYARSNSQNLHQTAEAVINRTITV